MECTASATTCFAELEAQHNVKDKYLLPELHESTFKPTPRTLQSFVRCFIGG